MSSYRWMIDQPLEITMPSKRTPWPDAPPELPSNNKITPELPSSKKITINQEQAVKRSPKTRSPRSKHSSRSKRKHEAKLVETQYLSCKENLNEEQFDLVPSGMRLWLRLSSARIDC
ncbi:hypothetical protein DKX38_007888 [Salix brachista]|uniref:Uncharacterized protein n=1 Tax=Salix brachista TaxID=2182728 RepID=A0A5N5MPJ4_9ROSI|nr:hypothetical protein DKX38_007888 [Salix brachista]